MRVAFVGTFACRMEPDVRARLTPPCEVVLADEPDAATAVRDADAVVTMTFDAAMGAAAGKASGRSMRLLGRRGRSWRAKRSGSSATVASANV